MTGPDGRPEWAVVSEYVTGSNEVRKTLQALGFTSIAETNGYSVQRDGHQVGVYVLTEAGAFRWGWVETPTGRTDVHRWLDFERLLGAWLHQSRERAVRGGLIEERER